MGSVEVSHSRVQTYERCPWKYHLVYDEGWRAGPSAPAALGQSIHRTLDAYLAPTNTEHTLERLNEIYNEHWVNEGFGTPQQTMEAYERGRLMLEHFFELDKTRKSEIVATEKEFNIEFAPGVHFRGTIDRLDRHPDGLYEVVEYKTQIQPWTEARLAEDRQITFYALGMGEILKDAPLKLTYYFLSSGTSLGTTRTKNQLEEARALILDVAAKIDRRAYEPNHGHCGRCEFGKRCANFKPS